MCRHSTCMRMQTNKRQGWHTIRSETEEYERDRERGVTVSDWVNGSRWSLEGVFCKCTSKRVSWDIQNKMCMWYMHDYIVRMMQFRIGYCVWQTQVTSWLSNILRIHVQVHIHKQETLTIPNIVSAIIISIIWLPVLEISLAKDREILGVMLRFDLRTQRRRPPKQYSLRTLLDNAAGRRKVFGQTSIYFNFKLFFGGIRFSM